MEPVTRTSGPASAVRPVSDPLAMAADAAAVLLFVVIGRGSHDEGSALAGTLNTAWPFLAGAALGWAALAVARRSRDWPGRSLPAGALVWAGAVAGGMALRHLAGGGTPWSFVLVGGSFLGLFLLGWRAAVRWTGRRGR